MKSVCTRLALMVLLLLSISLPKDLFGAVDEAEMKAKLPLIMGQNNVGKEYWFTIPPCYEDESGGWDNFIKILVCSPSKTKVVTEIPGNGYYKTKTTIPNGVIEFNITPTEGQPTLHSGMRDGPREAKVYKGAGIHVIADDPVVVYVMVRYHWTSDGFLAIPVSSFGTQYINMAYNEADLTGGGTLFPPFTGVTAAYDNTKVTFTMGGAQPYDRCPLDGGRLLAPGETTSETLNKGDVWLLSVDGVRQDISGSLFKGTKPFSIVSGLHCANYPVGNPWCDYTVEMELPTYTWGKQIFVMPMSDRTYNGIIRIFAAEDNTNVYRDGSYVGTIRKGGGDILGRGFLEMRVWPMLDDFGGAIPPKIATFTGDKPIGIMYYNTGTGEDANPIISDPFQMVMSPTEQFQNEIYFPSPNATGGNQPFTRNYINLIFELHQDFMPEDLLFAEFSTTGREPEWKPVREVFSASYQKFVIPYKGKYYGGATLKLGTEGVYGIKSDSTKFMAYSYGFSDYDSYGFPTAASLKDLTSPDTNAPVPTYIQECDGDILTDNGTVTDMPNDDAIRSNMSDLYMIESQSENYEFDWRSKSGEFIPGQQRTLSWWLTVIDKKKYAKAVLFFVDRAGNDTTITIEYYPPEYEVVGGNDFGLQATGGAPVIMQDTIRNLSKTAPLYITSVKLQKGDQGFTIDSYEPTGWAPGTPIAPLSEVYVNIKFDPTVAAALGQKPIYKDSLGVGYGDASLVECGFAFETEQTARLGAPDIAVEDYDFGQVNINDPNPKTKVITIKNNGTKDLNITGIRQDVSLPEYTHDFKTRYPSVSVANPLVIKPGGVESFTVSFFPKAEGPYNDQIVFSSDAIVTDSICVLRGEGIDTKVSAQGYEWDGVLINRTEFPAGPYGVDGASTHKGLFIANLGDAGIPAKVTQVNVISETPANAREFFRAGNQNIVDYLNSSIKNKVIPAGSNIDEVVEYLPTEVGNHSIEIELVFDNNSGGAHLTIKYAGTGLVPNLSVTDINYGDMLVNDEANAQTGQYMKIVNRQDEFGYPLTVAGLTLTDAQDVSTDITNFNSRTFRYDDAMIQALVATPLAVGDSVMIPVDFVARKTGANTVVAQLVTNGNKDAADYDDISDWVGLGSSLGLSVSSPLTQICISETEVIPVTLTSTGTAPVNIDEIALEKADLNNDGQPDLSIVTNTTNLVVDSSTPIVVNVLFAPSGDIARQYVGLVVTTKYTADQLSIVGADQAIEVEANSYKGKTTTNLAGATKGSGTAPYDAEYMVSIGDKFDYEINFETSSDVSGANVLSYDVSINYNKYFVQAEFANSPYTEIELAKSNMQIKAGSFAITDNTSGKFGDQVITFTVESKDGTPLLTTSGLLMKLPFLTVLPADNQQFDPDNLLDKDNNSLGRFDMSHTLSVTGCYSHESDQVEVGIREICTGNLRLLYVGDMNGQAPTVQPNPISSNGGTIDYSVPFDQPGEIAIYNTTMQKVAVIYNGELKQGRQSVEIPVDKLSNGAYYFKITMGNKAEMGRLIIQK